MIYICSGFSGMKDLMKYLLLVVICISADAVVAAFPQTDPDTLEMARQLRDGRKIRQAYLILDLYQSHHHDDLNATWLLAQTAYWDKRFSRSRNLYEEVIAANPWNYYLKLDFANVLLEMGELVKAGSLFMTYLEYDPENQDALLSLAKISFWQGADGKALEYLSRILKTHPGDQQALGLHMEIKQARSPWIKLGTGYYSDNQPVTSVEPVLEGEWYLHPLSTPHFTLRMPFFKQGGNWSNTCWFQAGNRISIKKAAFSADLAAGIIKFPFTGVTDWTGNLQLRKTFLKHLFLEVQGERKPYFNTKSSIDSSIIHDHGRLSFGWDDRNTWNGMVSGDIYYFPWDENIVWSFSAWGLTPPLKASVFKFRAGYGFSFSSSRENRFVSEKPLPEVIQTFDPNGFIRGIYNPYFTPDDQKVHSAVLSVEVKPVKILDLGVNANFGFYARAMIPYLYLDKNEAGEIIMVKGYAAENYFPLSVNASASMHLTGKLILNADYAYNSTYYFSGNYAGLGLKIIF